MGIGVPRDYKQATAFYTKASKGGYSQAESRVSMLDALTKQQKEDNKRATVNFQENTSKESQCVIM
jgi:TPR repeat protein